jgi:type IV pilus assembly protein PilW
MNASLHSLRPTERGIGLIEVLVSIVIAMLLVLVIYQVYEVTEGQKRTITAGSDAQQNASYGLYVLTRDLSQAGSGIASAATDGAGSPVLDGCALLRPVPVLISAGATDSDPDSITVLYGGSSSLATPVQFKQTATTAQPYVVPGPVGFSPNDVIVAVQGASCTLSTINANGVAVDGTTGFATLAHTPIAGSNAATYAAVNASLVNLGQPASMGRVVYTVDPAARALRTQKRLPTDDPVNPLVSDVVNLKAQYGLDTDNDGIVDTWQEATGNTWSAANLPTRPLATLRQIRAVRVAIVTRSAQYEKNAVTTEPLLMFDDEFNKSVKMTLAGDAQHYRYKVLETMVPLRNALWNAP